MGGGDTCDDLRDYSLSINIECGSQSMINNAEITEALSPCFKNITFLHPVGCKVGDLSPLWTWISKNEWAIAVPSILMGIVTCFYGITYIRMVYFFSGLAATVAGTCFFLFSFLLTTSRYNWVGWLVFSGSIVMGIGVGVIFIKIKKLGLFFLGSIGGFGFGIMLFNAAFYLTNSYFALYMVTLGFSLVNGLLTLYESEPLIIHASALFGVFFLGAGVAMFAGHYQNPFLILELIRYDEISHVDPLFYIYLGASVLVYGIGIFSQYRKLKQMKASRRLGFRRGLHGI